MRDQSRQQLKFQVLLAERAQFMRHNGTDTERALWFHLSANKLGVSFERQVVIDRFVADYLASSVRLVVESDGAYHSQRVATDAWRTCALQRLNPTVHHVQRSHDVGAGTFLHHGHGRQDGQRDVIVDATVDDHPVVTVGGRPANPRRRDIRSSTCT